MSEINVLHVRHSATLFVFGVVAKRLFMGFDGSMSGLFARRIQTKVGWCSLRPGLKWPPCLHQGAATVETDSNAQ